MRRRDGSKVLVMCLLALLSVVSCGAGPEVSREEMAPLVQTDVAAFSDLHLSSDILEDLASHRIVVLGETHRLREHWEFVATLAEDLHGWGFRQVLTNRGAPGSCT